ncbi:MAG: tRNA pseudouridine(55) synthase TruB [Syntrophomonas sp.]
MQGFLNVNKPQGITSYDVIRKLKRLVPRKSKLGHLGTLDPMATGVLPVALGRATKLIPYIENESKEYIATMTIGGRSDTQDAWGNITYSCQIEFDAEKLKTILNSFTGIIKQIPPMYSAVHYDGKRLYELARQGVAVERTAREVEIKALDLVEIDLSHELPQVKFKVLCSPGTYVRTLCHDIGEKLETGAYLSALLRTRSGMFGIEEALPLQEILDRGSELESLLMDIDYPLTHLSSVKVEGGDMFTILNGGPVLHNEPFTTGLVKVYSPRQELLAIAETETQGDKTLVKPVRVLK